MSFTLVKGQKTSFTTGDNKEQMFPKCPVRENNQVEICFKATKQKAQKNLWGSEMSGGKNTFTYVRYVALESEVGLKKKLSFVSETSETLSVLWMHSSLIPVISAVQSETLIMGCCWSQINHIASCCSIKETAQSSSFEWVSLSKSLHRSCRNVIMSPCCFPDVWRIN